MMSEFFFFANSPPHLQNHPTSPTKLCWCACFWNINADAIKIWPLMQRRLLKTLKSIKRETMNGERTTYIEEKCSYYFGSHVEPAHNTRILVLITIHMKIIIFWSHRNSRLHILITSKFCEQVPFHLRSRHIIICNLSHHQYVVQLDLDYYHGPVVILRTS